MAFEDFDEKQCVCDLLDALGDVKTVFTSLLDAVTTILTTVKAAIALWPEDPADRLLLLGLQAELEVLALAAEPIVTPLNLLQAYFNQFGDCPGISTVGSTLADFYNMVLGAYEEKEEKINAMIEALDLEGSKIDRLDDIINQLDSVKEAIELCGEV
jgi:hypothetical protein